MIFGTIQGIRVVIRPTRVYSRGLRLFVRYISTGFRRVHGLAMAFLYHLVLYVGYSGLQRVRYVNYTISSIYTVVHGHYAYLVYRKVCGTGRYVKGYRADRALYVIRKVSLFRVPIMEQSRIALSRLGHVRHGQVNGVTIYNKGVYLSHVYRYVRSDIYRRFLQRNLYRVQVGGHGVQYSLGVYGQVLSSLLVVYGSKGHDGFYYDSKD